MKKRILSFLLALCLLCSLLPVTAFAAPSSQPVYVAFTSDVHSKTTNASDTSNSPYRLNQWLTNVSKAVGAVFDNMVFCGDNADGSGAASGDDFWNKVQTVMEVAKSNTNLQGNGLFLAGNHEWENGNLGNTTHAAAKNIQEVGTKVVTDNYVLYLFGASSDDQKNTGFKTEHINALDTYLSSAPTDRPIFITSHFPIHTYGSRSTKNADKMISTLNKYGDKLDLYFIWGHNHSQSDNNYDTFFDDDDKLLNTSINFVYCAAGCMSDREYTGSGSVQGKGLVAKIVGGKVESLSYYGTGYTVTKSYTPVYSQAPQKPQEEYVASGKCGDNLTWTLDDKGTLTVSGTGPMGPWEDRDDVSWYAYLGQITSVVLENGVTTIGDYAFVNAEKLSSITIPRSVTQIGRDAFTFCSSLTKITLPDSITSIGDYAFYACSNLSGISIPAGVTRIGDHTFFGCRSIKKIELPKNIAIIDDAAFYSCESLETVLISGKVTIGEHAFDSCNQLKSVTFESDAPTIDPLAFNGVKTTCYYPVANDTWTTAVKQNYGGTITWIEVCPGHKWSAATCTTPKTCSVCGATDGEAKGHNHIAKVTAPTCTERGYTTYTCTCGDSYVGNYVGATGHDHTSKVTAPTCTQQGYTTYTCKCGDSYIDKYVESLGHNEVTDQGYAATCTKDGLTDGKHCDRCGTVFTSQERISKLGHDWSGWETTRDATCSQEGSQRRDCSRCDTYETRTIEKPDHQYKTAVTAPTCTAKGYTTYTCRSCGDTYTANEVAALGHSWDAGRVTTEPTEDKTGTRTYTCGTCGGTKTESIPALGHTHKYTSKVTVPTCTEKGYTTYTCTCGNTYTANEVAALGHSWDAGRVTTEPTEDKAGTRTYTCGTCGNTRTESIPALGHTHKYTSKVTVPTCTEKGFTTYTCTCGDSYAADYVDATGHAYENGSCGICGAADPDYVPDAELFELAGANMVLGNNLAMNFFIETADLAYGEDYYAVITKDYADDREDLTVTIQDEDWQKYSSTYYRVTLTQIAAKEMADLVTVVIYNAEGEQVSEVWEDSVRDYTMRGVVAEMDKADPDEELMAVYVEMLNYGAAAQEAFSYNVDDLANNELTEAHQAYGLDKVEMEDFRVSEGAFVGTSLTLESNILMNFYFSIDPADYEGLKAVVTYTDHSGNPKAFEVKGENFVPYNATTWGVTLDTLVVADCRQPVTVKVCEADGELLASVTDSVESYAARRGEDDALSIAIMRFAVTAYNTFH